MNCNGGNCSIMTTPVQVVQPPPVAMPSTIANPSPPANVGALAEDLGGVDRSNGVGSHDGLVIADAVEPIGPKKVGALDLPEDGNKPYITIVGTKEFQAATRAAIDKAGLSSFFHVVGYVEGDWHVADVGLTKGIWVTKGRNKDGTAHVVSCDPDVEGFAKCADQMAEALRKDSGLLDKLGIPKLVDQISPRKIINDKINGFVSPLLGVGAFLLLGLAALWK